MHLGWAHNEAYHHGECLSTTGLSVRKHRAVVSIHDICRSRHELGEVLEQAIKAVGAAMGKGIPREEYRESLGDIRARRYTPLTMLAKCQRCTMNRA